MAKKLFVGQLNYRTSKDALAEYFSQAGELVSAEVIYERDDQGRPTPRSKGFGFVEFVNDEDADKAIDMFNGKEFEGRTIVVNEARPMERRAPRNDM